MSLEFVVASDIERDSMNLEVYQNALNLLNIEETAEGDYLVQVWSGHERTTFTVQETALIVAHALKFAGLRVREPGE
ncbi:hypothetical protein DAERI_120031 [Deinococcus aerius]|uniref:Uncharacterized protein n=1 Tax=Deinococcus aerius TaxID=200253 RepID=A0A2I9DKS9_9DEIO|nr:hypothetical protein [Deinococcus aerius]GBF07038.1 hypothetical protein DAERI_120031 [Deinococcus aerius]